MSLTITAPITIYNGPRDGLEARRDFLALLKNPGETWGAGYALTDPGLVQAVLRADRQGIKQHWLLDASQFAGVHEHAIWKDVKLTIGDITLSTAGPMSSKPRLIMHKKTMVVADPEGGEHAIWIGSFNFTETGWYQANDAVCFRSRAWAEKEFIPWFVATQEWARKNIPQHYEQVVQAALEWNDEVEDIPTLAMPEWLDM